MKAMSFIFAVMFWLGSIVIFLLLGYQVIRLIFAKIQKENAIIKK